MAAVSAALIAGTTLGAPSAAADPVRTQDAETGRDVDVVGPIQPDLAEMGMNPGKLCTYELTRDSYTGAVPTLFGTLRDSALDALDTWSRQTSAGGQVQAEFRLSWGEGETWTSSLSSAKASGSQFRLDLGNLVDGPTLPVDTPIEWDLRAYDGEIYGPWSSDGDATTCRFVIDPTTPSAPIVTSADFPTGDVPSPMVGEDGTLTVSAMESDVVSYQVDFNKDDSGPTIFEPIEWGGSVTVDFRPESPGIHLMTVRASDAADNSSSSTYWFRVSVPEDASAFPLTDPVGSTIVAEDGGDNPGTAGPGVTFGVPGPGTATAAEFNGTSGAYISTNVRGIAHTNVAFAASAWVRVDALNRDQTIVTVDGSGEPGFVLGYRSTSSTSGTWMLQIPDADIQAFNHWRVTGGVVTESNRGEWVHVAGVYDDHDRSMYLYVNGQLVGVGERKSSWRATNAIQIGRSYDAGLRGRFLDGAVADVRVFDRYVAAEEVGFLTAPTPTRAAYWPLNTDGTEYLGGNSLTFNGGTDIYQRETLTDPRPLIGTGHLVLDGVSGYAQTDAALIDSRTSFGVALHARLSGSPTRDMTVFALPGENTDLVTVRYSPEVYGWQLVVATSDSATAETVVVTSNMYPDANGQGLAVTYDDFTGQMRLWVDGIPTPPLDVPFTLWETTGLRLGLSSAGDDYFAGAIDAVRAYDGYCSPSLIEQLAVRLEQPDV